MIDELIEVVARSAGLSRDQAALAVGGMLRFMAARLPSPLFGELQSRLQGSAPPGEPAAPIDPPARP